MSDTASPRRTRLLIALCALVVIVVVGVALWRIGDDGEAEPVATGRSGTTGEPSAPPTEKTAEPTADPTASASCEGPDTQFNLEGVRQESLLPDCGTAPVTPAEQKASGLGLACGGTYPVILYKTTTSDASTSICGKDASGAQFRFVTRPDGGTTLDLPGEYDPQADAFTAEHDGVTYAVTAYNGELRVTRDGQTSTQASDGDWISLDNESDYD